MRLGGFRFSGVAAGIKKQTDRLDVGLLVADTPSPAAALFTRNRVKAAPVLVSMERIRSRRPLRGVVAQSGNANACTGLSGLADAREMTALAARALGARASELCVASTGVIGFPLPMDRVRAGIRAAADALSVDGWDDFTRSILTTDRGPKSHVARAGSLTVAGCAKGAGMIAPDLATTLAFVVTDANVSTAWLRRALREEADATFNSVTVDGDTSTNDSLFAFASGAAGGAPISRDGDRRARSLRGALREVLLTLATSIVRDGEGATRLVRIEVAGCRRASDARAIARRIANSPLVKTAIGGADPNWGRLLAAAGAAGVPFDPARLSVDIGDVPVVRGGAGVHAPSTESAAHAVMSRPEYTIRLTMGSGRSSSSFWTCDLTHEYVRINADYRS